jgi:hypothetical protein
MSRAIGPGDVHRRHLTLNTDGRPHPRENAVTGFGTLFALIAIVSVFFPTTHLVGSWAALAGIVCGLWAQMISATTAERFVNVSVIVLSGVGLLFGLAHGGLY